MVDPAVSATEWKQQQKLVADDGNTSDLFGYRVALSSDGTTALIMAPLADGPDAKNVGSAYIFTQDGGEWSQQQKLVANDGNTGDLFGFTVALSGDGTTAFIGAPRATDPAAKNRDSAHAVTLIDGKRGHQQKLTPNDGDNFGPSVALSSDGTTALVEAFTDENPNGTDVGSVYVFTRSDGEWGQQQKLTDSNTNNYFGISVMLSNDGKTAIVGTLENARSEKNVSLPYVFSQTDGEWSQQQRLMTDDGDKGGYIFGTPVSLSDNGTTVLIGNPTDDEPNGKNVGSAYVFTDSSDDDNSNTGLSRFDTNNNGTIDFTEVIAAIAAHNSGTPIGAEPVDFDDVIAVIRAHNTGTPV